ncbi:bifunctional 2-polyprenyl-6-hydroxyphenol methylase/3-demethylubiquinol 3-O-methyltransferase UbiG [uncultured Brevundimonas sp.]|uniref:class I SAM-dependent methyltransferase n=1 Tax=uncultured Brevundimonas sp. TaxID=213418 RepID=UPI0025F23E49|nr:class I SAM-dependent methyltransferase [uncultured Brevundimonas sp.]
MGLGTLVRGLIFGKDADRRRRSAKAARVRALPDRRVMADSYVPALAADGGRILWVGCREYTLDDYALLETQGGEVWTTDIDPAAARWGREGRHRTGDVCEADRLFPDLTFDAVVCNGVLGYGVDSPDQQQRALKALAAILRPGGRLLLGWNTDKIADPVAAGLTDADFQAAPLGDQPTRVQFDAVTHVYDSLIRRG